MAKAVALTTLDNPYSPFEDFKNWYIYDMTKGYGTCELLSRFAHTSPALSDTENYNIINDAIDDIIDEDFEGIYIKVFDK